MEGFDYSFLASFALVGIALLYSYKEGLGIEKNIALASMAALLQLTVLGFALTVLFKIDSLLLSCTVFMFMALYGSFIAVKRTKIRERSFLEAFFAIGGASFCVLGILVAFGVISTKSTQIIPLAGMVVGNVLNVYTQFVDRLESEIANNIFVIEGKSALGASTQDALSTQIKAASRASLMPTLNTLQTVGFIHIPGVAVGMILAGASPMEAISFQLVIMFMIVGTAVFGAVFAKILLVQKILSSALSKSLA